MSEGALVILGTLSIFGLVAIASIALVFNRTVSIKAGSGENKVELQTAESTGPSSGNVATSNLSGQ